LLAVPDSKMEDGSPRNKTNGRWTKEEHLRFL